MNKLKEYIINFGNLALGKHEYEFTAGENFFSHYDYSLVKHGDVKIHLLLDKESDALIILDFVLDGYLRLECDTCLDPIDYPLNAKDRLILKLDDRVAGVEDDEIVFLLADAYQIDISPYIYEFINLEMPLKSSCSLIGKECNPNMLQIIDKTNGAGKKEEVDPRWEVLKKLNGDKK